MKACESHPFKTANRTSFARTVHLQYPAAFRPVMFYSLQNVIAIESILFFQLTFFTLMLDCTEMLVIAYFFEILLVQPIEAGIYTQLMAGDQFMASHRAQLTIVLDGHHRQTQSLQLSQVFWRNFDILILSLISFIVFCALAFYWLFRRLLTCILAITLDVDYNFGRLTRKQISNFGNRILVERIQFWEWFENELGSCPKESLVRKLKYSSILY